MDIPKNVFICSLEESLKCLRVRKVRPLLEPSSKTLEKDADDVHRPCKSLERPNLQTNFQWQKESQDKNVHPL